MTIASIKDLEYEIERLVQSHIAACHQAALTAVGRAFGSASVKPRGRRKSTGRTSTSRRTPAEMEAVREQLYEMVCAHPGETMTTLATLLDSRVRALQRPMARLKEAGRVRSVGQRNHTRYFPMAGPASRS